MTRLLVADDEPAILEMVAEVLGAEGYDVLRASCGREASRLLATGTIDLLLTDLHMPAPDGFGLVKRARSLPRSIPIAMMSGTWTAEERLRAGELGIARLYDKPVDLAQLARDLRGLVPAGPTPPGGVREVLSPGQGAV